MPDTANNRLAAFEMGYRKGMETYINLRPSMRDQHMRMCQDINPFKGQCCLETRFEQGFLKGFRAE